VTDPHLHGITLFPAIDLRGGRCVRLEQGLAERETVYRSDPLEVAAEFARLGAEWIHVVDLDGAFGDGSNRGVIMDLARTSAVRIQSGGGLRNERDIDEVLAGSVSRAVIGTAAIENPELVVRSISRWGPERIAVGLDARGLRPAVRGWKDDSGEDLFDIGERMAGVGVRTLIYTDISRDGMFSGPNIDVSVELARRTGAEVIVSGGVGRMEDLDAVVTAARTEPGIAGVIVGKAIYEGRVEVGEAVRRLRV